MQKSNLRPVDEARQAILDSLSPLAAVDLPLDQLAGRILAQTVTARLSHPSAAVSAMDGWAVRQQDIASLPARLAIIGEAGAGHPFSGDVTPGSAVRIFTGGLIPQGADTIIIQEEAEKLAENQVQINHGTRAGRYIRPAGMDFASGQPLLEKGQKLGARHIALAALAGHGRLSVHRRPKLAILTSGDELVAPGSQPGPGQLINSNSLLLEILAREQGADVLGLGILPDRPGALDKRLAAAEKPDLIVTTGGASVGDHDHIVSDLQKNPNSSVDFWKIAMRPGKPLIFGHWQGIPLLGLPGNPVSAAVCGLNFLVPALARLQGSIFHPPIITARLASDLPANDQREDYIRARLSWSEKDGWTAFPANKQDSAMLKTLAEADGLIIRKPHASACPAGSEVRLMRLPAGF